MRNDIKMNKMRFVFVIIKVSKYKVFVTWIYSLKMSCLSLFLLVVCHSGIVQLTFSIDDHVRRVFLELGHL